MRQEIRVQKRVHTRKIDRAVAHKNMKEANMQHVNKHDHYGPAYLRVRTASIFAKRWKDFV